MTDTALAAFTALLNNAEDAEERKALYDIVAEELEIRELLEWSLGSEGGMFHENPCHSGTPGSRLLRDAAGDAT